MCRCNALNGPWELFFHKILPMGKTVTPETFYEIDSKS
jgi:hypothetical protein